MKGGRKMYNKILNNDKNHNIIFVHASGFAFAKR